MKETQISCQILLVNTYMVQISDPGQVIFLNDELRMKSKKGLERESLEALTFNTNPLISIETNSRMGSVVNVVRQIVKAEKIDLVAMGRDGGKHVEQMSILLKEQGCPLLITSLNH